MQTITTTSALHQKTTLNIEGLPYSAILFTTCQDPLFSELGCTSIFQQRAYHAALEYAPPERMSFWYVRIEQDGHVAGMLSFQVKDFNPGESLKNQVNGNLFRGMRYKAASLIRMSVLCLGNTLVTGIMAFAFNPMCRRKPAPCS